MLGAWWGLLTRTPSDTALGKFCEFVEQQTDGTWFSLSSRVTHMVQVKAPEVLFHDLLPGENTAATVMILSVFFVS